MRAIKGVFLTFLLCYNAFGAVAFVQASSGGAQGSSTTRTTSATATTIHNTIVSCARVAGQNCATNSFTVTDTAGNTYYQIANIRDTNISDTNCLLAFVAKDITANATNVVTLTSAGAIIFSYINAFEFSGVDRDHPRDTGGGDSIANVGGTNFGSGPYSTFVADEALVVCMYAGVVNPTWTYSSGFTSPAAATPTDRILTGQYRIYTSLQTATSFVFQTDLSAQQSMILVGLRGASGARIQHRVTSQ